MSDPVEFYFDMALVSTEGFVADNLERIVCLYCPQDSSPGYRDDSVVLWLVTLAGAGLLWHTLIVSCQDN